MKIGSNTFVSLTYELKVDGELVDKATVEKPLEFIYDAGFLLPSFEENIKDLEAGHSFDFKLEAVNGYGELMPEAVIELPTSAFMVDGKVEDGMLTVGNQIPMMDNQGHQMVGIVVGVEGDVVKMDFNHPLAGKDLHFTGKVEGVREVTDVDRAKFMGLGGGCGCGCGQDECGDDCGCEGGEENKGCGCGCN